MAVKDIIGTWDLISLFAKSTEGEIWKIFGADPVGMLTYTAEWTMSAVLMKPNRSRFTDGIDAPTVEELREAFLDSTLIAGPFHWISIRKKLRTMYWQAGFRCG